ncbi:unnamed protein product [Sphagnum jensenii]|uniref:Uncharacterized protein n=1 Tax=Sphagnum jensenii TaxID=128206 RepID=A0ABP1BQS3_9BRYO
MSANTIKHEIGRKPYDARQHFIQTDRMANKMQRFIRLIHCTDAFDKGVPGAHEAEANLPESFVSQFVSRQSFQCLIKFCNAKAAKALPTRQLLGGLILNKYLDKVDLGDHATLKVTTPPSSRKRVNFLSDT